MGRLFVLACVFSGILVTASVALADHGDAKPACADLVNWDPGYPSTTNIVTVTVGTTEPTCKNITYSLVVIPEAGAAEQIYSRSGTGTTAPFQIQSEPIDPGADNTVCVYVMTSRGGKEGLNKTLDRLENVGCTNIVRDGSGGGAGHA